MWNDRLVVHHPPLARDEGKAESITLVSRILAQRRVRRGTDWFAPFTSSLKTVRVPYYSSSSPLQLLVCDRLFSFRLGLLADQLGNQPDHAFDRPQQGIPGEDYK